MVWSVLRELQGKYYGFVPVDESGPLVRYKTGNLLDGYVDVQICFVTIYTDFVRVFCVHPYEKYHVDDKISDRGTLLSTIDKLFVNITNDDFGGAKQKESYKPMAESKISALDVEINRSRNKLKYMEAQLFPSGVKDAKAN